MSIATEALLSGGAFLFVIVGIGSPVVALGLLMIGLAGWAMFGRKGLG